MNQEQLTSIFSMNEKEIKDLAREYAEIIYENYEPDYEQERKWKINSLTNTIIEFVNMISSQYCLVEKSKVIEAMKYPQRHTVLLPNTIASQCMGIRNVLTDLFGSELFNEPKQ